VAIPIFSELALEVLPTPIHRRHDPLELHNLAAKVLDELLPHGVVTDAEHYLMNGISWSERAHCISSA